MWLHLLLPGDLISYFLVSFGGYLVVWLETANRRFLNGDYDFGVIATLSNARVLCSKSDFMLHKTYLAVNVCSSRTISTTIEPMERNVEQY